MTVFLEFLLSAPFLLLNRGSICTHHCLILSDVLASNCGFPTTNNEMCIIICVTLKNWEEPGNEANHL